MNAGKLIKELRIKKGMTQEELADKTEVSARTIQRIENGEVDPRAYTLQMIARALEVDFSIFTEEASDEEKESDAESIRYWLGMIHLSGLLPLFFPTFMIWNQKKGDIKEMTEHYYDVISFQLNVWILIIAGLWIQWKGHQPTPLIEALFLSALLSLLNTIRVMNGRPTRYISIFKIGRKSRSDPGQ